MDINDKPRIAIEIWIDNTLYSTHYCDIENLIREIEEIKSHKSWKIGRTYYTNNYGVKLQYNK